MAFLADSFTEASGTPLLDAHTGETGATWTKHPNSGIGTIGIGSAIDRARVVTANGVMLYTASGSPASADYEVSGVVFCATVVGQNCGVISRVDTAADTYYAFFYSVTNLRWELRKQVAGVGTALASSLATLTPGNSYGITLRMIGSSIKGLVGGVEVCSVTDASITAAGKAGVRMQGTMTDSTSVHLDSIAGSDAFAKSLADTVTASDATGKAVGSARADTVTVSDAAAKGAILAKADAVTASDATAKAAAHPQADSLTASDAISKAAGPRPSDSLTASDATTKATGKAAGDSLSASDALAKALGLAKPDTLTVSDLLALAEGLHLGLSDSLTASDSISRAWAAQRALADTLALAEGIHLARLFGPVGRIDAGAGATHIQATGAASPAEGQGASTHTDSRSDSTHVDAAGATSILEPV